MKNQIIQLTEKGTHCTIIEVLSDIDVTTARVLDGGLQDVAEAGRRAVVDLSECPYMDSSGISVLIKHTRRLSEPLLVVAPEGSFARRVIEITGVNRVVALVDTLDAALVSCDAEASAVTADKG
ncbi:MAG: STAS domain-containing protein [Candidatus Eremiobacteraeota bacterium]|nr:STAS domain-containing protein [Candidatus Eremiobacteraeota bacterium]